MFENASWTSGKVLIVYYSLSGNTARVARDLARLTQGDLESLRDLEHGAGFFGYVKAAVDAIRGRAASVENVTFDPRKYSLVIIGTPVWAGHMTPAVRGYLKRFAADLPRVAFFVTSGNTDARKIVPSMAGIIGHGAEASAGFSARELANQEQYDAKLGEFLGCIQQPPIIRIREPGAACCP